MVDRTTNRRVARKPATPSPTLQDVAQAAGVSTATVSRCLNSPELVVEQTRERVLAVVQELGYAPNFGARALAAKRTNTIGAIIPTMENAIFARGLQAFQEELARHGLTLLVASSSYSPKLEEEQIRTLLARGADALLLIGFERSARAYELLQQRGVPYVIAWAYSAGSDHHAIGFDNRAAMRALARQVFGLGHRDVAIIAAPMDSNDRARERVLGIWDAAAEVGLDRDALTLVQTPYSIENGARVMAEILAGPRQPTAVMCGNDVLAVGAMGAARAAGLSVPGDLSITGFDDIEIAGIVTPGLTTVHVPHRQMGIEAARVLATLLSGGAPPVPLLLETQIISRASLGPVSGT
ncbi:HTH-type transcriptional repressor [Dinoroseobacter shibae DFL 12 = DSM 16493]|jgi:LacI family transcriptional regulator|uniref:HTH-type transcriptional repressor n=1 Tax=Dinoroseobacter shibae (strain DSM 16493 / NCIMB 14021 / DFL 12) TaxID=398580 RepID=A8LPR4_DINSH|nr:LacI family DNA-binding transcriptional regulator [Dinoroseobacter shibae]ABV93768.1 HTH-type transcriptional repressor [Dinoroseobacter shibae DFL 12 = DSM 16493]URF45220.1 LacI family DNA-binding transcriptional regulator [Dinoroseobacter shibae]URF49525.1 LacI family DNA-binding transcriptional regulator [Dinoroseobacter shibae]